MLLKSSQNSVRSSYGRLAVVVLVPCLCALWVLAPTPGARALAGETGTGPIGVQEADDCLFQKSSNIHLAEVIIHGV